MTYGFDVQVEDERASGKVTPLNITHLWPQLRPSAIVNHETQRIEAVTFPAPYDDLTLADGEFVSGEKARRVREANAFFGTARAF